MIFENKIEKLVDQLSEDEGKPRDTILLETLEMLEIRGRYFREISRVTGKPIRDLYIELMDNFDALIAESNIVDGQTTSGVIKQKVAERKMVLDQLAVISAKVDMLRAQVHQDFQSVHTTAVAIRLKIGGQLSVSGPVNIGRVRNDRGYFTTGGRVKPGKIEANDDETD